MKLEVDKSASRWCHLQNMAFSCKFCRAFVQWEDVVVHHPALHNVDACCLKFWKNLNALFLYSNNKGLFRFKIYIYIGPWSQSQRLSCTCTPHTNNYMELLCWSWSYGQVWPLSVIPLFCKQRKAIHDLSTMRAVDVCNFIYIAPFRCWHGS